MVAPSIILCVKDTDGKYVPVGDYIISLQNRIIALQIKKKKRHR